MRVLFLEVERSARCSGCKDPFPTRMVVLMADDGSVEHTAYCAECEQELRRYLVERSASYTH